MKIGVVRKGIWHSSTRRVPVYAWACPSICNETAHNVKRSHSNNTAMQLSVSGWSDGEPRHQPTGRGDAGRSHPGVGGAVRVVLRDGFNIPAVQDLCRERQGRPTGAVRTSAVFSLSHSLAGRQILMSAESLVPQVPSEYRSRCRFRHATQDCVAPYVDHNLHRDRFLEYACPVWHSSLTVAQTKALELLQQRAMKIIFPDKDYLLSLIVASVDTLESRREQLTERFFRRSVLRESSCLHYLLPDKRDSTITDRLRHAKTFTSFPIRTEKFRKSFIPYCLNLYDQHICLEQQVWIMHSRQLYAVTDIGYSTLGLVLFLFFFCSIVLIQLPAARPNKPIITIEQTMSSK